MLKYMKILKNIHLSRFINKNIYDHIIESFIDYKN